MCLYSFFFYSSDHHRTLHSFPTRRSSDLMPRRGPLARCPRRRAALCDVARVAAGARSPARGRPRGGGRAMAVSVADLDRSEEHTSELQSRRDLVCRLLLEKKKKQNKKQIQ